MRKLLFLLSIFAIVLSCSSDETSTPVTPPAPIVKYTITLSAGEGGTVSTTGGEYEAGQTVTVTATPQGEYLFKDWSDGNTNATRTITVNSNTTLTANFEKKKYPLTVNIEGEGEVLEEIVNSGRTTDYDSGTTVKLTAVPAEGWEFAGWTGAIESEELEVQLLVSESKNVTATFIRNFDYSQPSYYHFKADFRFEPSEIARNLGNYNEGDGYITSVAYADFNLDGYIDLVYAKGNNTISLHPVEIYLNSGDNKNFIYNENYIQNNLGTEGVRKSIIGDFNGDKKPDVFFADHGAEPAGATQYYGAKQSILLSNNDGYQFNVVNEIPKEFNHGACSGDFDNDGDLDIFTATGHFLVNDGNANFTLNEDIFESDVVGIFTTEMIDINNDGFLDLFVAGHSFEDWDMKGPTIFYGNGSNFSDANSIVLNDLTSWGVVTDIDFVDLNNDGFLEILLNRTGGLKDDWSYFYKGWRIQIFENNMGTEFIDETQKYIDVYQDRDGRWTVWYRVQDIDLDGELELFDDDPTHNGNGIDLFWDWNGSMFIKK